MNLNEPYRWQQWVVGAGSTAGSTAAVISEESMKCLKYCSHWLQYAIQNIHQQMNLIQNYLVSITTNTTIAENGGALLLETIKNEMISTLKKAVDVITRYAGNALPYQAKTSIRKSILTLPNRWAKLNNHTDHKLEEDNRPETLAVRLLTFGQESSDMLNSVYQVFDDTIQRAEGWLKSINAISSSIKSSFTTERNENNTVEDQELYNLLLGPIRNLQISS